MSTIRLKDHLWLGLLLITDVDECSLGIHQCHPNSRCINLPGWYYCDCKEGYYSSLQNTNLGAFCQGELVFLVDPLWLSQWRRKYVLTVC